MSLSIFVTAMLGPEFYLGRSQDFIFYKFFYVSRTRALYIALAIFMCALLPNLTTLYRLRRLFSALEVGEAKQWIIHFHEELITNFGIRRPPTYSDARLLTKELLLALAVALTLFSLNRTNLLGYIDGQYLLTLMDNQAEFDTAAPIFSANPLQGLGDVWYFSNTLWIPEFSLARPFSDPNVRTVIIHTIAFLEILLAVSLLAYWLHGSIRQAIGSGWLAAIAICSFTYPPLLYPVSADAPQLAFLTVVPIAAIPLLYILGCGSVLRDGIISISVVAVMWLHFIGTGIFAAVTYPFLVIVSSSFLVADALDNRVIFFKKLIWYVLIAAMLAASGLPQILLGFSFDNAFHFYSKELARAQHVLSDGSLLFRTSEPLGVCLVVTGILGAFYSAIFSTGVIRQFGTAVVATAIIICVASAVNATVGFHGAIPIYYEYILWLVYPIYATVLLTTIVKVVVNVILSHIPYLTKTADWFVGIGWLILPLVGIMLLHGPNYFFGGKNERPNVFPPKPSPVTEFLRKEIGLSVGSLFKGRVATVTGHNESGTSWAQAFTYDMNLIREVGNDHRSIGLWYYNIPTLFEFNHTIRPRLYMVAKYILARETDSQFRTLLNFQRPNIEVLRLLGVRYLVTDNGTPTDNTRRIGTITMRERESLSVDEISNANFGVSPTKILVASDRDAFRWVGNSPDFQDTAVIHEPVEHVLTRATQISISIENNGIRVRANSPAYSLVVVPFQYSHCIQVLRAEGHVVPRIMRADFLLTGLLFGGNLDAVLGYRQGPFVGTWCGMEDLDEDRKGLKFDSLIEVEQR
jgi:hypothetical protein